MKVLYVMSIAVGLVGCGSKYNADALRSTKRVAIISLFANEQVPEKKGRGVVKGWDEDFKIKVAQDAADAFSTELAQLGWTVVTPSQVIQSEAYQSAFAPKEKAGESKLEKIGNSIGKFLLKERQKNYFTPTGMYPIELADEEATTYRFGDSAKSDPKQLLARFAKELDVDAVILVKLDYCYEGGTFTSLAGLGEAYLKAASSLKVVNRKGDVIVNMPNVETCADHPTRASSKGSVFMNGGDIVFGLGVGAPGSQETLVKFVTPEKLQRLFSEATRASAEMAVGDLKKAMK